MFICPWVVLSGVLWSELSVNFLNDRKNALVKGGAWSLACGQWLSTTHSSKMGGFLSTNSCYSHCRTNILIHFTYIIHMIVYMYNTKWHA